MRTQGLLEAMKELLAASNPGVATKQDLARIEERLDELNGMVDELAVRLDRPKAGRGSDAKPPPTP